jgi:hypothetical protein
MSYMHLSVAKEGATAPEYNLPVTIPTYSIKDVFCGVVNITYSNPMNDRALIKNDIPY